MHTASARSPDGLPSPDDPRPGEVRAPRPGAFRQLFDSLFSVVFPDSCRICEQTIEVWTRVPVCPACINDVSPLKRTGNDCAACGLPLPAPGQKQCGRCEAGEYEFDRARSYGAYEGTLREVLHLFKFHGMRPLAGPLGARMADVLREGWASNEIDAVIAVPLAAQRLRERGFNQAELLAREVARRAGLPLVKEACRRKRATPPQTGLTRAQRLENLRGAFVPGKKAAAVSGLRILLVDDVFTTGATLSACARVLRHVGARSVCVLTLARTLLD